MATLLHDEMMDRNPWTRVGLAAAAASFAVSAWADQLITKTGETLQGAVVEETADAVVFESRAFGKLTVPRESIVSLTRETAAAETSAETAAAAESRPAQATAPGQPEQPEPTSRAGRFFANLNPLKGWKSSFFLGFTARRGEDNDNNLNVRFRSERKAENGDEHLIESRFLYAEDVLENNLKDKTDELLTASYQYRHGLTAPFYFQSNSGYYRDVIKDLDHEVTQTGGVGARLKRDWWSTSFTPSAGVRYRDISGDNSLQFVVGAYQDLEVDFTKTLKLRESLYYLVAPDNTDDYSTRLAIELNQKISTIWSLGFRYDYTYDAVVGTTANRTQQRWALTLGLDF
jgi:putative salt-induced outer membrane protein YdiY